MSKFISRTEHNLYVKNTLTKELLETKLISENLSIPSLAIELGFSIVVIRKYIKKFNLIIPKFEKINLSNKKFGKLTVIDRAVKPNHIKKQVRYWRVRCDCGNEFACAGVLLTNGNTKSCGCLTRERSIKARYTGFEEITGEYFNTVKNGAERRNITLEINIEDMWNKFLQQDRKCALSNVKLTMTKSRKEKGTASLDRKDSTKGYTIDNIQWIHKDLNQMKMEFDDKKFRNWCDLVSLNNKNIEQQLSTDIESFEYL